MADGDELPLLAVPVGRMSLSPWVLAEAASGLCRLAFLADVGEADPGDLRVWRRLGTVLDLGGAGPEEWAGLLAPLEPAGLAVFSDDRMVELAGLAAALGLEFHPPEVARRLRDKSLQRAALRDAGLGVPATEVVDVGLGAAGAEELAARSTYPAVLKPRFGMDSRATYPVPDGATLLALLGTWREDPGRAPMVLEGYLGDTEGLLGEGFADYCSVESVVVDGAVSHFATTGRLPPAEPFRETGFCIPSAIAGETLDAVERLAADAIRAVGVRRSCVHTEIKMTPEGPRVIEVNGRLGGGIPAMVDLATGASAVRNALRLALREDVTAADFGTPSAIGYRFMYQAPTSARRVARIDGLDRLAASDGVHSVAIHRGPGTAIDWRVGNHDYVFGVTGAVATHAEVLATYERMLATVHVEYEA